MTGENECVIFSYMTFIGIISNSKARLSDNRTGIMSPDAFSSPNPGSFSKPRATLLHVTS